MFAPRTVRSNPFHNRLRLSPRGFRAALFVFAAFIAASPLRAQTPARFKVLVLGLPDPNHPATGAAGNKAVQEIAAGQNYTVDICLDHTRLTDEFLAPYQVMVWTMAAPLDWPRPIQASIEKFVQSGKGWIGFHVSGLTGISNPEWTWYQDWLGGLTFKGHPATRQNGTVKVEAAAHPVLAGIPSSFSIHEEWYSWTKSPRGRADITILATVDESSYAPGGSNMPGDHPVMWSSNKYGPMIYTCLGHEPEAFSNANIRKFLANAIPWAANPGVSAVRLAKPMPERMDIPVLRWDGHRLRAEPGGGGKPGWDPDGRTTRALIPFD
ncbi:MAG: hypothetical protein JWP91_4328 [Fibrobacteres bacterium]|nr:hypothetical protein [Fibrobacterota bacterium]